MLRFLNIESERHFTKTLSRIPTGLTFVIFFALCVHPAKAQYGPEISRQTVNSAIQSTIRSIRDQIQRGLAATPAGSTRPLPFQDEAFAADSYYNEAFRAFGYTDSMRGQEAFAASPAVQPLMWGLWGTGTVDYQRTTVLSLTTINHTHSAAFGGDVTKIGIFGPSDALVIGVNGSDATSRENTTHTETPGVGAFISYINGGFSTDFEFNTSWSSTSTSGITPIIGSTAFSYAGNAQYKFDLPSSWWIEPTVGIHVTDVFFDIGAFQPGETTLVQGGARLGTSLKWNGITVEPTLLGLAYSNVRQNPGGLVTPFPPPTGEGQVWGKGDAKLNFVLNDHFSAYVEGEVRGTSGAFDAVGYSGMFGARYTF